MMKDSITGTVFDISHYMIEDGPGIRTSVFVKGCFLKCKWCSNAYGLSEKQELSYIKMKCSGCGKCIPVCRQGANSLDHDTMKSVTDFNRCTNCLECTAVCPTKARSVVGAKYTSEQVLKEVEKDLMFYRRGEGGVTLSGGEILMQPEFVTDVLKKCSNAFIHTAIETSGFGKWEHLRGMIDYSDVIFIDCKHMNRFIHKEITGVDNGLILENIKNAAEYCSRKRKVLVIRFPLIPSLNDSEENIVATAKFVKALDGDRELNVLPYHNYGVQKYDYIGLKYEADGLEIHTRQQLERCENLLLESGVRYSMGGHNVKSYL